MPSLAFFGYFVTILRIFYAPFTGLNSAVVSQNWQIWGVGRGTWIEMCNKLAKMNRQKGWEILFLWGVGKGLKWTMMRIAASISLNWKLEVIWPDQMCAHCRVNRSGELTMSEWIKAKFLADPVTFLTFSQKVLIQMGTFGNPGFFISSSCMTKKA